MGYPFGCRDCLLRLLLNDQLPTGDRVGLAANRSYYIEQYSFSSVFFLFVAFPFLRYVGSGIFARSQLSMVQPTAREGPRGLLFKRLYRCDVVRSVRCLERRA